DGVMVKAREEESDNHHFDLSHFVVHTGSQRAGGNRFVLTDKKEFVSLSNRLAREQVLDYLYNHFEMNDKTLLITNSDGGHGYTPYVFKEMAKALRIKRHEHFWDEYHVNKQLKKTFKPYGKELLDLAFQAIQTHDKGKIRTAFETAESLEESRDVLESLATIKKKFMTHFQYTLSAEMRGLPTAGIGIMESQHRKITYRMKKRGMYWTFWGAETMAQLIVMLYEGDLRELFFGCWREEYHSICQMSKQSVRRNKASKRDYFPEHRRPGTRDYQRS
ncbi:TPA: UPF0236 family transposase-like protein, partial [Streptococcus agalactiae]